MRTNRALVKAIQAGKHPSADDTTFGALLWRAAHDIIKTEESLQAKARGITDDMARLMRGLENDPERPWFNSLGELQSRGPELDRLCGVLDIAYENFDRLYAAWCRTLSDCSGGTEEEE